MALFDKNNFERTVKQYKCWTSEQDIRLKAMIKENKSLQSIAKELGKTPFAVIMRTRYISGYENHNVKGTKPENLYDDTATLQDVYKERMQKWSEIDNDRLKQLYGNGENIFRLANIFHRSPLGVLMHLQEIYKSTVELNALFDYAKQFVGRTRIVYSKTEEQDKSKEVATAEDTSSSEVDWEKYNEEQRQLYPNHGKPWTKDDESLLVKLFVEKECSIETLTQVFRKNPNAIARKLVNLNVKSDL